jgi:hypothetical protein
VNQSTEMEIQYLSSVFGPESAKVFRIY